MQADSIFDNQIEVKMTGDIEVAATWWFAIHNLHFTGRLLPAQRRNVFEVIKRRREQPEYSVKCIGSGMHTLHTDHVRDFSWQPEEAIEGGCDEWIDCIDLLASNLVKLNFFKVKA